MAAALPSHITFFTDLRDFPADKVAEVRGWVDWYKRQPRGLLSGVTYPLLDDPLANGWTALQSGIPTLARGALLAFRQRAAAGSQTIGLRNVPDGRYRLRAAPDDAPLGEVDAAALRAGVEVTLPLDRARVIAIERVGP